MRRDDEAIAEEVALLAANPRLEDDPAELVETIAMQDRQMEDTGQAKEQFLAALVRLIDERIARSR